VENTTYDPLMKPAASVNTEHRGDARERSTCLAEAPTSPCCSWRFAEPSDIPARPVFGLRIDGSSAYLAALVPVGNLSGAQQCRAEFYTPGLRVDSGQSS
jgi:hypothetical protein